MAGRFAPLSRPSVPWRTLRGARRFALVALVACSGCISAPDPVFIDPADPGFALPEGPVILVYVDGLHKGKLEELTAAGEMPLLKKYLFDRGTSVDHATVSVPSVTYANAATMVTGVFPNKHGVVGNRWFDRNLLIAHNYESYAGLKVPNVDIRPATIYEILDDRLTAVIGAQVNRGVRMQIATSQETGGLPVGLAWFFGMQETVDDILARNLYELVRQCREAGRWPDFTMLFLPAPDEVGHHEGHESPEYADVLRALDDSLGNVLKTFDEGGILDRMTVVLTSDHGCHTIDERLDLPAFFQERLSLRVFDSLRTVEKEESYLDRRRDLYRYRVAISENAGRQAHVHLRSRRDWSARPSLDDVLAFHRTLGTVPSDRPKWRNLDFPEMLVEQPAIAFVAVRLAEGSTRVYGKNGVADLVREKGGVSPTPNYRYLKVRGDVFGYRASATMPAGFLDGERKTSREWLEATAAEKHPDVVPQLVDNFDSPRSGDLMLFAAPGYGFTDEYAGGHGGLERDEMIVPMYFAGGAVRRGERIPCGRLVDLLPTALDLIKVGDRLKQLTYLDGVSLAPALGASLKPATDTQPAQATPTPPTP
jgi:arylsulfatase A-like enzyme